MTSKSLLAGQEKCHLHGGKIGKIPMISCVALVIIVTAFFSHFTPHLCEQYPKDLRFSFVITDIQAAHLSKYLLSNHAISHSLPKICVGSSHSKQKC